MNTPTTGTKRKSPNLKGGSRKGIPNKINRDLKEMILEALHGVGGVDYLMRQARKKNPAPFMALVGRALPMTVKGEGEDGAIIVKIQQF